MWKVSCFYEKVHDLANFGGYTRGVPIIKSVLAISGLSVHINIGSTPCVNKQQIQIYINIYLRALVL